MNFNLHSLIGLPVVIGLSFLITEHASAQQLFDIDFESPLHTIGSAPAVGGPNGPSEVRFSNPIVVEDNLLPSQSLEFQLPTAPASEINGLEQIVFELGTGAELYRLRFDLIFDALIPAEFSGESFKLNFDTPTVQNLSFQRFDPEGPIQIKVFQPRPDGPSVSRTIGTVEDGEVLNLVIEVDVAAQRWTIVAGQRKLFDGNFFVFGNDLESVRFSLSDRNGNGDSRVLLDNIEFATGPEVLLGDCNLDGAVNFLDIIRFISILSAGDFLAEADANQDEDVDFTDISPFIDLLSP